MGQGLHGLQMETEVVMIKVSAREDLSQRDCFPIAFQRRLADHVRIRLVRIGHIVTQNEDRNDDHEKDGSDCCFQSCRCHSEKALSSSSCWQIVVH